MAACMVGFIAPRAERSLYPSRSRFRTCEQRRLWLQRRLKIWCGCHLVAQNGCGRGALRHLVEPSGIDGAVLQQRIHGGDVQQIITGNRFLMDLDRPALTIKKAPLLSVNSDKQRINPVVIGCCDDGADVGGCTAGAGQLVISGGSVVLSPLKMGLDDGPSALLEFFWTQPFRIPGDPPCSPASTCWKYRRIESSGSWVASSMPTPCAASGETALAGRPYEPG